MKKTYLVIALAFGFVFYGCDNAASEVIEEEVTEEHEHDHDHHHDEDHDDHHGDIDGPLVLNDGLKWEINEEMTPHVQKGEEVLKTYIESENTDYATLSVQLNEANAALIGSCTMEGQSHDELHKWLYPHIDFLNELKAAESVEEANEIVEKLDHSFKTFHEFFE